MCESPDYNTVCAGQFPFVYGNKSCHRTFREELNYAEALHFKQVNGCVRGDSLCWSDVIIERGKYRRPDGDPGVRFGRGAQSKEFEV